MATQIPVYTLTPNPALDLSGHVARLLPNEKNYVYDERRDPGGNGINSARIIHRLRRVPVLALGFAGGATGREVAELLKREGVPTRFTPIAGYTRTNVTASNDEDHRQTRLTFPGPEVTAAERAALLRQLGRLRGPGIFIASGSLPGGLPADFHARVARAAQARGLAVIADVPAKLIDSFRPRSLKAEPLLMIKPNQAELEEWSGRKLGSDRALIEAGRELLLPRSQGRGHEGSPAGVAALVCISLAERGAILLAGSRAWMGHAPKIRARGTVGAGDSMVGAMATMLARGGIGSAESFDRMTPEILEPALAWGLAAGAATAQSAGTSLAAATEIRKLVSKVRVESLT